MPTQIVCPACRRPQEDSGRLTCPDCGTMLHPDPSPVGPSAEKGAQGSSSSALDEPAPSQTRPSGAMTLLRNDLRTDEKYNQSGWLENILPRRGKSPTGQKSSSVIRGSREQAAMLAGQRQSTGSSRLTSVPLKAPEIPQGPS